MPAADEPLLARIAEWISRLFSPRRPGGGDEPPAAAAVPARLPPNGPPPLVGAVALREPVDD